MLVTHTIPERGHWLSHTISRRGHARFLVLDGLYLHTPGSSDTSCSYCGDKKNNMIRDRKVVVASKDLMWNFRRSSGDGNDRECGLHL
jgi:hypothetical protein